MYVLRRLGSLLSVAAVAEAALTPRSSTSLGQLYAYGTNITGFPIFYSDAVAYIGDSGLLNSSTLAVNFTLTSSTLVAKSTSAYTTSTVGYLGIDTATDAFEEVIFTNSSTDYSTTGFVVFGHQVTWEDSQGVLETNFVAVPSELDGLWILKWNAGSSLVDTNDTVLVVVKNIAPPSSS